MKQNARYEYTCFAGSAIVSRGAIDINSFVNEMSSLENGIVTFASSTGREVSYEGEHWGNGVFTKALKDALGDKDHKSQADLIGNGDITIVALDFYLEDQVKLMTKGAQHPVMIRPPDISNFPIFIAFP